MFGAFRPTASLSVGLLWKIPWRLSAPRKLRQRRRLRKVDNVVAVLDTALRRQHQASLSPTTQAQSESTATTAENGLDSDLAITAQGQSQLTTQAQALLLAQRRGRGPKRGELLPVTPDAPLGQLRTTGQEAQEQGTIKLLERWKADMPSEGEMVSRDKYTMFDRKERGYRKGVHKGPKWTRVSQRLNPPGF